MYNETSTIISAGRDDDLGGIARIPINNLISISALYFKGQSDQQDVIQEFLEIKIFSKSDEKTQDILSKGNGYIIKMFINFCIDIKRRQRRDVANYRTDAIDTIQEQQIPVIEGKNIDEKIESIIHNYKGIVAKKHNDLYAEIFVLMAQSYSTKEIAMRLKIEENRVNTAKSRIRKSLRCFAASIIL
ncbi:MAG: hypothetical protein AAFZ15_24815 [Bacteroidota bacterium]